MRNISMKTLLAATVAFGGAISIPALAQGTPAPAAPVAQQSALSGISKENLSYAIGVNTARNLVKDGVEIDPAVVLQGMQDVIGSKPLKLGETEIKNIMNNLVQDMRMKFAANRRETEELNRRRGDEFRAAFAKESDVRSLPDGVLFKVIKSGNGTKPTDEDSVLVNYRGTHLDGKEFDATPEGKPAVLPVKQLIAGWKEALRMMPVGSRWKIVIPAAQAYDARGMGGDIGPNETLIFDVELLSIVKNN